MPRALALALLAALLALAGFGAGFVYFGLYNVSAIEQHTSAVYWLLQYSMRRSVRARSEDIAVPPLDDPEMLARGFRHYRAHCAQCHGAPGRARADEGKGMTPVPVNLAQTAREWPAAEIYWVIKHGIKMTGMPAWKYRMSEEDLWATTAFVMRLPGLRPAEYRALERACGAAAAEADDEPR